MKVSEIADFLSAELVGDRDANIVGISSIEEARETDVGFLENAAAQTDTRAGCILVPLDFDVAGRTVIKTANPKLDFARVARLLHPSKTAPAGISRQAIVGSSVTLGENVFIDAFTCIGDGVSIGDGTQIWAGCRIAEGVTIGINCTLRANVVVEEGSRIGNGVILHAGVVIGADGFGYVRSNDTYLKFPQVGTVVIENDVEVGANTCVDRGSLGETRIGEGTKIDNLVQIAHNVQIGKRVVIAAQTGISGSTVIEDDCVIGGQVGIGDHARILSGTVVGSQAGILPGKIVRPGVWWGTPVQPLADYKRQNAHVKGLERLKAEVKALKTQIDELIGRGR
ncbi:MAG: UDP-3-O-(3-hydroxymyristoyl)glucosamine N-acyltransferase [Pyrinomonadaceae bacterium]